MDRRVEGQKGRVDKTEWKGANGSIGKTEQERCLEAEGRGEKKGEWMRG